MLVEHYRSDVENYLVENPGEARRLLGTEQLDNWEERLTPEEKFKCWCLWNGLIALDTNILQAIRYSGLELVPKATIREWSHKLDEVMHNMEKRRR